jgi:two-component system chemotaxis response regulator CheB
MVRVLIVEDSITVGIYLEELFNREPDMEVIGRVTNGKEAVAFCRRDKPDVITMDIEMPVMNGLEATRKIMSSTAVPIVVLTASRNNRETRMTMQALEAGAVTLIEKPRGLGSDSSEAKALEMVNKVRLMAGVKVITRRAGHTVMPQKVIKDEPVWRLCEKTDKLEIVAIGVSTGGPAVLKQILGELAGCFPLPIVVVQHIAPGFLPGMVNWLQSSLEINVKIALEGEKLQAGTVYFAPDSYHLLISRSRVVHLQKSPNEPICPSVAQLFASINTAFGKYSMAIMLTGMGRDGAIEMKNLYDAGAVTIAQSKDSALVYGMPAEAVKQNAVRYILSAEEIAALLKKMENKAVSSN